MEAASFIWHVDYAWGAKLLRLGESSASDILYRACYKTAKWVIVLNGSTPVYFLDILELSSSIVFFIINGWDANSKHPNIKLLDALIWQSSTIVGCLRVKDYPNTGFVLLLHESSTSSSYFKKSCRLLISHPNFASSRACIHPWNLVALH